MGVDRPMRKGSLREGMEPRRDPKPEKILKDLGPP